MSVYQNGIKLTAGSAGAAGPVGAEGPTGATGPMFSFPKALNYTVSSWTSNANGSFSYRGNIAITGVTATMIPTVCFSAEDQASGAYSGYCESYDGGIYIWSSQESDVIVDAMAM